MKKIALILLPLILLLVLPDNQTVIAQEAIPKALLTNLTIPGFSEYGPVPVSFVINNKSDVHIRPKPMVTVSDWFGKLITQTIIEEQNIFPDTAGSFSATTGQRLMMGRYKVELSVPYGENNTALEGFAYFWVVPWRVIAAISLTLAILFILFKNFRDGSSLKTKELERKVQSEEEEIARLIEELKAKNRRDL